MLKKRLKVFIGSFVFLSLYVAGFAQEPLSVSDVETLVSGGVAQRRIVDLIRERGVNFDLTDDLRDKLKKTGAGPAVMQSLELAAIRFRLDREAERTKLESSKKEQRRPDDTRRPTTKADSAKEKEPPRSTEPAKRVEKQAGPSAPTEQKPSVPDQEAKKEMSQRQLEKLPSQIQDKGDQVVALQNVTVNDGEVSGELVNNSQQSVFGIELQVLYSWRWNNDFHPGADDPGRADNFSIDREIPPRQIVPFRYKPSPPLPQRKDGSFDITVKVIGFTKLFR